MRQLNNTDKNFQEVVRVALMTIPALIMATLIPSHPYQAVAVGFCGGALLQSYLFPMSIAKWNWVFRAAVFLFMVGLILSLFQIV